MSSCARTAVVAFDGEGPPFSRSSVHIIYAMKGTRGIVSSTTQRHMANALIPRNLTTHNQRKHNVQILELLVEARKHC